MQRLPVFLGSLALAVMLTAAGCASDASTPERSGRGGGRDGSAGAADIPVTTAAVVEKTMPLAINVIGTAEAYSNVAVHPQITGELTSVDFKEGDDIRKGEIIFTLDFRPLESALEQARGHSRARHRAGRQRQVERGAL